MNKKHSKNAHAKRSLHSRSSRLRRGALIMALSLAWAQSQAGEPDTVIVFGDSAADMGNLFSVPGHEPGPKHPYFKGPDGGIRMSDGAMWPELLYSGMKVAAFSDPAKPVTRLNFAAGAATTGEFTIPDGVDEEILPLGVQSQIESYRSLVAANPAWKPGPNSYAFIEAGPNDLFEAMGNGVDLSEAVTGTNSRLAASSDTLAKMGFNTVFVTEMPDVGAAPLFDRLDAPPEFKEALRAGVSQASAFARSDLRTRLSALQKTLEAKNQKVILLPFNHLFEAVRKSPTAFGFDHATKSYYDDSTDTILDADKGRQARYVFVDLLHTTATAQALQARYYREVIDAVEGQPQVEIARLTDGAFLTGKSNGEAIAAQRPDAVSDRKWTPFLTVTALGTEGDFKGANGKRFERVLGGAHVVAGVSYSASNRVNWGAYASTASLKGNTTDDRLEWDDHQFGGGLFVTAYLESVYVYALAEGLRSDYKTSRDSKIPTFFARGKTKGTLARFELGVERPLWANNRIKIDLTAKSVLGENRIDAFTETGAAGLDLSFNSFKRRSIITEAGIRASGTPTRLFGVPVSASVALLGEHEAEDRETSVDARLVDNTGALLKGTANTGASTRFIADAALSLHLRRNWVLTLQNRSTFGREGSADSKVSLSLNARF